MPIIKCGFEVTRNEEEKIAFEKFYARIEEKGEIFGSTRVDDQMIMRFLRARALDMDRAEQMFLESLKWREESQANTIVETYKPVKKEIKTYLTGGIHKCDRDGDPLLIDRLGQLDVKGVIAAFGEEELLRFDLHKQESMERLYLSESARQGRLVERLTCIMDLQGLGLKHLYGSGVQTLKKIVAQGEANYPERLKRCFIINAPSIFSRIWSLIKGFFDPRTQKKIFILGDNYYSELVKYIPEENIPEYLGGKSNINGDIYCKDDISPGGIVPHHLYSANTESEEGENTVTIKAGAFHVHSIEVLERETLKWKFRTENKDIGFELILVRDSGEEISVLPMERKKSDTEEVEGEFKVTESGKYVFKWDNTFSWTRSKNLTYTVERIDSEID